MRINRRINYALLFSLWGTPVNIYGVFIVNLEWRTVSRMLGIQKDGLSPGVAILLSCTAILIGAIAGWFCG